MVSAVYFIVVYLVEDWEDFHRRPMLEALAKNAEGRGCIICVNPRVFPPTAALRRPRQLARVLCGNKPQQIRDNLWVLTPIVWLPPHLPIHGFRRANRSTSAIGTQIRRFVATLQQPGAPRIAWVYRPEQERLLGLADETTVVYECYDEYRFDSDGRRAAAAEADERRLLQSADIVLTTAESLYESRSRLHQNVHFADNGVDFELFHVATSETIIPYDLTRVARPRVIYIGRLGPWVDFDLLGTISQLHPEWSLCLVGPDSSSGRLRKLARGNNVHYFGFRPRNQLPNYLAGADVAIIPFVRNEFTKGINPLKLYEYLAGGVPVVSTSLPDIIRYGNTVHVARSHEEFVRQVAECAHRIDKDRIQRGVKIARRHSWTHLTRETLRIVEKHVCHCADSK